MWMLNKDKSQERMELENIRKQFMLLTGKDGCTQYNTDAITKLCNALQQIEEKI